MKLLFLSLVFVGCITDPKTHDHIITIDCSGAPDSVYFQSEKRPPAFGDSKTTVWEKTCTSSDSVSSTP